MPKSGTLSISQTAFSLDTEASPTITPLPQFMLPSPDAQGVSFGGHQLRPTPRRLEQQERAETSPVGYYSAENRPVLIFDLKEHISAMYKYWTPSMDSGGVTLASVLSTAALNTLPGIQLLATPNPFGVAEPWIGRHIDTCAPVPLTEKEMLRHEFAPWIHSGKTS